MAFFLRRGLSAKAGRFTAAPMTVFNAKAEESFSTYHFRTPPISVFWGQQDAFQHLNNVEYFRFVEQARILWFQAIGERVPAEHRKLFEDFYVGRGIGPIMASISCKFIRPVTFPDNLTVGLRVPEKDLVAGTTEVAMDHCVVSEQQQRIVATGTSQIVFYDYKQGARAQLPLPLLEAIRAINSTVPKGH